MAFKTRPTILAPFALAACALVPPATASGQDAPPAPAVAAASGRIASQADLFAHNVMIAKPDVAAAAAQALLDESISPEDLAAAVDGGNLGQRLEAAFRRSRRAGDLAGPAAALESKLEAGRRSLARQLSRIDEAVGMLVGPMRGQELAKSRLMAAGDHAVPALLRPVVEGRDSGMEAACTRTSASPSAGGVTSASMARSTSGPPNASKRSAGAWRGRSFASAGGASVIGGRFL